MDVQPHSPKRAPSAIPGTRDCWSAECGAKQGMLLRDVVQTDQAIRLIYVCERCGADMTIEPQ